MTAFSAQDKPTENGNIVVPFDRRFTAVTITAGLNDAFISGQAENDYVGETSENSSEGEKEKIKNSIEIRQCLFS